MSQAPNFDFLQIFIEQMLDHNGFEMMPEKDREHFVSMFMAEAEKRLGLALMPRLSDQAFERLMDIQKKNADAEAIKKFWLENIPNFETEVENILRDFVREFKSALGKS